MKTLYVVQESVQRPRVKDNQEFYSVPIELDDWLAEAMEAFEQRDRIYREWLTKMRTCYGGRSDQPLESAIREAPSCLREGTPNVEQPKPQDTEAPSSKSSPDKQPKTASSALMSQKARE